MAQKQIARVAITFQLGWNIDLSSQDGCITPSSGQLVNLLQFPEAHYFPSEPQWLFY